MYSACPTISTVNMYRLYCLEDQRHEYVWDTETPSNCPVNEAHAIDPDSVVIMFDVPHPEPPAQSAFGPDSRDDAPAIQLDFRYGVSALQVASEAAGGGSVSACNSMARVGAGASHGGSAALTSKRILPHGSGKGVACYFPALFDGGVPSAGNERLIGIGNDDHGYFFGYDGANFGVMRRSEGSDQWVHRGQWNVDRMDGEGPSRRRLDPSKGNVYSIDHRWLGFGSVGFGVREAGSGAFLPVHRMEDGNSLDRPAVLDPSFPATMRSENSADQSDDLSVRCTGFAGYTRGKPEFLGQLLSAQNTKTVDSLDYITNVLTIRNKTVFRGKTNSKPVRLAVMSVATNGTRGVFVHLLRNASVGGTRTWEDVDAEFSVVEYDTTGSASASATTINGDGDYGETAVGPGASQLSVFSMEKKASREVQLRDLEIDLFPGDAVTLGGRLSSRSTGTSEVTVALAWLED